MCFGSGVVDTCICLYKVPAVTTLEQKCQEITLFRRLLCTIVCLLTARSRVAFDLVLSLMIVPRPFVAPVQQLLTLWQRVIMRYCYAILIRHSNSAI
jgi:hypothetical protein